MSAAALMEKMPLAKSSSLKTLSKTIVDKVCAQKGQKRLNIFNSLHSLVLTSLLKHYMLIQETIKLFSHLCMWLRDSAESTLGLFPTVWKYAEENALNLILAGKITD